MPVARLLTAGAIASIVMTACGDVDRRIDARTVELGAATPTARGGRLAVRAIVDAGRPEPGFEAVAASVRACAPRTPVLTRADPEVFGLETHDGRLVRGEPGREPALRDNPITPGRCITGWVTFRIRGDQRPTAVVYLGATRIRWRLT